MKQIRKLLFWAHLIAGVVAGIAILIMCVSGVLLAFEEAITVRADGHRSPRGETKVVRTSLDGIMAQAASLSPETPPASAIVRADPSWPIAITFGREKVLLFDAVSGEYLGPGAQKVRAGFRFITDWHRWLGRPEASRAIGRAITGAGNLAFLFLLLSGVVIWLPRKWSWSAVRAVAVPNFQVQGRARDWNWHNVVGLWSAFPLLFVITSGVVMSYPWANNLLFRLAGSEPPPARRPETNSREKTPSLPWKIAGLDRALAGIETNYPGRTVRVRLAPAGGPATFAVDSVNGRPQERTQLTIKLESGEVVRQERPAEHSRGRKWRLLARFLHTGEALGVPGQIVAAGASAGGALLVWTGLALACRRFFARKAAEVTEG